jgi:hypothetical protein
MFNGSRAAFASSLSVSVTDRYENALLGETRYRSTGFADTNMVFSALGNTYDCAGCNGSFELSFTSTSVGGSGGVFGVGLGIGGPGRTVPESGGLALAAAGLMRRRA